MGQQHRHLHRERPHRQLCSDRHPERPGPGDEHDREKPGAVGPEQRECRVGRRASGQRRPEHDDHRQLHHGGCGRKRQYQRHRQHHQPGSLRAVRLEQRRWLRHRRPRYRRLDRRLRRDVDHPRRTPTTRLPRSARTPRSTRWATSISTRAPPATSRSRRRSIPTAWLRRARSTARPPSARTTRSTSDSGAFVQAQGNLNLIAGGDMSGDLNNLTTGSNAYELNASAVPAFELVSKCEIDQTNTVNVGIRGDAPGGRQCQPHGRTARQRGHRRPSAPARTGLRPWPAPWAASSAARRLPRTFIPAPASSTPRPPSPSTARSSSASTTTSRSRSSRTSWQTRPITR